MEYERITKNKGVGRFVKSDCITCGNHKDDRTGCDFCGGSEICDEWCCGVLYNRLAELEDKIEQGKMRELPCNVGDTVYIDERTWTWYNSSFNRAFIGGKFFVIGKITSIRITEKQILIKVKATYKENYRYTKRDYPISAIGKTVFLTREEAEQHLKELQQ